MKLHLPWAAATPQPQADYSLRATYRSLPTPYHLQPSLLGFKFAHMEDVRIPARDGLELVAYLTRADSDKPTPLVCDLMSRLGLGRLG